MTEKASETAMVRGRPSGTATIMITIERVMKSTMLLTDFLLASSNPSNAATVIEKLTRLAIKMAKAAMIPHLVKVPAKF